MLMISSIIQLIYTIKHTEENYPVKNTSDPQYILIYQLSKTDSTVRPKHVHSFTANKVLEKVAKTHNIGMPLKTSQ